MSHDDARCFCSCCCYDPARSDKSRLDCTCKVRRHYLTEHSSISELLAILAVVDPPKVREVQELILLARGDP